VAIDIAKARHEVLIAIPDKKQRRRLTVLNELADVNRLVTSLKENGRPVRVAFEATGNYHRALAYNLATTGFEVKLVSSMALARTREALNNSWDKNDSKDAQVILHMMEIGNEQYYHDLLVCGIGRRRGGWFFCHRTVNDLNWKEARLWGSLFFDGLRIRHKFWITQLLVDQIGVHCVSPRDLRYRYLWRACLRTDRNLLLIRPEPLLLTLLARHIYPQDVHYC
jgi:hypothetical protein